MPVFMHGHVSYSDRGELLFDPVDTASSVSKRIGVYEHEKFLDTACVTPVSVTKRNTLLDICITYADESLDIRAGQSMKTCILSAKGVLLYSTPFLVRDSPHG